MRDCMPRAVDHGSGVSSRIGAWEGSPRRPQIDPALRPFPSQMLVDRARVSVPESWAIGPSPIRLPRNAARHNAGIQEWGIHDARSPHPPNAPCWSLWTRGMGAQGPSVTADQGGRQPRSSRPKKGRPLPSTEDDPGNPSVDFGGERRRPVMWASDFHEVGSLRLQLVSSKPSGRVILGLTTPT